MFFNCGCGKLEDNMGNPKNITNKTFEEAAIQNCRQFYFSQSTFFNRHRVH